MDFKKIIKGSLIVLGTGALFALAGCAQKFSQEEVNDLVSNARSEGVKSVDVTVDNDAVVQDALVEAHVAWEAGQVTDAGEPRVWIPSPAVSEVCSAYTIDNLYLNSSINEVLDDNDYCILSEGSVSFDDEELDYRDTLTFTEDVRVGYSGSSEFDNDLADTPRLVLDTSHSVSYTYLFEDLPDWDAVTEDESLEINFFGQELTIIDADALDNSITVADGYKVFLRTGQTYEGLTLDAVDADELLVTYNGQPYDLTEGRTERLDDGTRLRAVAYEDTGALFTVGDDVGKTYQDGDEFLGEDEDDPNFRWAIDLSSGTLGWEHDVRLADEDESLRVGESFNLPNGLVKVDFVALNEVQTEDYTFELEDLNLDNSTNLTTVVHIEGDLEYNDGRDVREGAWDGVTFYARDSGEWFVIDSLSLEVNAHEFSTVDGNLTIDDLLLGVDWDNDQFAMLTNEGIDLSTRDTNVLTRTGYVISDPEDNFEDSKLELNNVPDEDVEYGLVVSPITVEEL